MVKESKACKGELETGRGADFRLIQPLDITAVKTAIIRSPDRRIAGSPDRRIAGSPDRRIALPASGWFRRLEQSSSQSKPCFSAGRRSASSRPTTSDTFDSFDSSSARTAASIQHATRRTHRGLPWITLLGQAAVLFIVPCLALLVPSAAKAQTAPACTSANGDGSYTIPFDWALKPSGLAANTNFRLLFVTSTTSTVAPTNIATHNTFVQTRAKAGHNAISDSCGNLFKVVGSTSAVDARDNTSTTGTGEAIYWLNGAKVADNYGDFYDGSWDSYAVRTETGASLTLGNPFTVATGSKNNGTKHSSRQLGSQQGVELGNLWGGEGASPLEGVSSSANSRRRFYGLSPVFKVSVENPAILSIDLSQASITEGDSGQDRSTLINYRMSKGYSAQFPFLACVDTASSTATHRTASGGKAADWNLVLRFWPYAAVNLNADGGKCHLYNYPANVTNRSFRLSVLGDATAEENETAVVTIKRASGTPDAVVLGTASATLTINNDDGTPPVITITGGAAVTEGTAASFTVNANPAPSGNLTVRLNVSDDDTSDFVASGNEGAKTVTIPASQASATFSVATEQDRRKEANGEVTVEVTASDGYTVGNTSSATVTVSDDTTPPRVSSITRQSPSTSPTNADSLVWRVTFSEPVGRVKSIEFQVSGTTASLAFKRVGLTNTVYDVTASGGDLTGLTGTVTLGFVDDLLIEDSSGNKLTNTTPTGTNDNTFVVDNTAPRVTSITRQTPSSSPTNADSLVWRVTFNEAVQNVNPADFVTSGNGSPDLWALVTQATRVGNTNAYDVTVSGDAPILQGSGNLDVFNGTVTLEFANGQDIEDSSGNSLSNTTPTGTNDDTFVVDNTAPRVTSITRQTPSSSPTDADSLTWRVLFNEAVQNVNAGDFQVSGTNATLAVAQVGATNAYDVTASGGNLAGLVSTTVTLSFANGQDIEDSSGNGLTNTTPTGTNHNTFVVNNNSILSLSLASSSGAEGNSGSRDVNVNIWLVPSATASFQLCVKNTGTATFRTAQGNKAKDFDLRNSDNTAPLTVNGSNCKDFSLTVGNRGGHFAMLRIFGDTTAEGNETAVLELRRLSNTPADVVISPTAGTATYTITNDDGTPPVITISGGTSPVTEGAGASFTVNANSAPTANLDVSVAVSQSGAFVSDSNRGAKIVTIAANATSKTYTVPTVNDMVDEANGSVTVTVNNGEGYTVGSTAAATVMVNDNDTAAVTIVESGGTSVTEASGAGRTDTYTVVLATQPTHSVTITPTSDTPTAATVSPGTLTFTTTNWNNAQTVTVTGVDDNTDQPGNRSVTISHSAASTDANYNGNTISIANVTATVVDNDTAAVNISTATVSVTEASGAGRTNTYTVVLATRPTHSVTITPISDTPAAATVSPGTLTFTTTNWNSAQTVTVTGVDDNTDQSGNRSVTISHSAASTDANYNGNTISIANVTATVVDNDGAGLSINETGTPKETRVTETGSGNTDTYTVVLATRPTHEVTITPTSDTPAAATVSPATLTFTTSNWNTAQPVTVTGVNDSTDNPGGGREVSISHAASSTDTKYTIASGGSVEVMVGDDDPTTVTLSSAAGNMEEGQTKEFTITLGRGLVDGEILTVPLTFGGTATRGTDYTMTGTSATGVQYNNLDRGNARVVFNGPTSGATATRATITLRATADNTAESTETVEISLGAITNTGLSNFGGVTQTDSLAPFTIADGTPAGVSITESGGSTSVTEAAGLRNTDTYTVVLKSQPTATVTIAVTSDDPGAATVSPATLSFTPSNWNSAQTVTVTGVDDDVDQTGNRSVIISHSATSTDAKYNGNTISIPSVTATVVDDDNTGPSALPAVEFTAAAYSGGEASGNRTINVALRATPAFTAATSISYSVSGTATAGEDFTPLSGTVSMTGGAGAIPITILQDQMDDDGETIVLTLIAANGYAVGTQGSATITITDDDGTTPPPSTLPVVSITGGGGVSEGEEASFTVTATPAPPPGTTISVNVRISDSSDFASSGQTGSRSITVDASGRASFTVTTEDDTIQEEDGRITATVQRGSGYTPHDTTASASVTVADDEVVRLSHSRLRVAAGGNASYQVALDDRPTGDVTVTIRVGGVNGEGGAVPSPNLSPPGTSPWDGANTMEGGAAIRVHPATLTFTPANWHREQPVTLTVAEEGDLIGTAITLTHTATGGGHVEVSTTMRLTVVAAHASEEIKAWHLRLGRTLAHQVVTALEERWSAPPVAGLQLTVAGETVPSAPALAEHEGLLTKALGFETVTPQELVEGSSFSVAPGLEGAAPRLAFWGQGALSSFSGEQEALSLDGDVTTLLLGADWHTEHWQAGAALSQSWGSGSYDGENGADGEITSTVTGLFPYGRYALTPRLGLWAITGYGWGELSLKPDGEDAAKPNTTLGMVAVGLDGVLLHGGSEGITLTTTADVLTLKTTSAEVDGLDSSEGSLSRRRVGLEAVRPFPLSNGASLLPSMALGIRHDSGDAEAGYGMDLGTAIRWQAPQQGISGELKGHTLLTHTEESLQEQGLALSFSWQPHLSNRGPSLSLSHAMGATAAGDMDTVLTSTTMEGLDTTPSNGQRLTAELAYGFPAHNDHITLTPAVALALSPTSRNYGLLWSVAPYAEQLQGEPWELSLTGQRQEQNTATAPVDHSLKLTFSSLF